MNQGRFGIVLIAVALAATLSVAAGAGLLMVFPPLPDPAVATRTELFRWLVLRDLNRESASVRQTLVRRVDSEFDQTDDLDAAIVQLDDSQRAMLWHNITVLMRPWLEERAEQYARLPAAERTGYLDRFLASTEKWSRVAAACFRKADGESTRPDFSLSKALQELVDAGSSDVEPEQQRRMAYFLSAVQARWVWRQLPEIRLFGGRK